MAESSAFYYLSVDRKDIFFTKELIKLNFEQRLYLLLRESGYENIYFFELANGKEIDIFSNRQSSLEEYRQNEKKGFWQNMFSEAADIKLDQLYDKVCYVIRQKNDVVKETIQNLIMSKGNDKYAFVMEAATFSKLYSSDQEKSQLVAFLDENRYAKGSSFFLTGEPNCDKCPGMIDVERITWNFYDKRQIARLLERVNIAAANFENAEDMEEMQKYLCQHFGIMGNRELLGEKITGKEDLYELLSKNRNMDRLKDMACSIPKTVKG